MALLIVENLTVLPPRARENRWGRIRPQEDARPLVDEVSFSIPPSQSVAIIGEKDSGTLPLAFALTGLTSIASGRIVFQDRELSNLRESQRRALRRQMPILFADEFNSLPPDRSIGQTLVAAHANGGGSRDKGERIREIERAMDRAGASLSLRDKRPAEIAAVDRQRVALARALLQQPRLIVLHEFTRGLDPASRAPLVNRLSDLQEDLGLSYLMLTSELALADHFAPELHVMTRGKIVDSGPRETIINDPQHDYTKRLIQTAVLRHH
ncbi:MAG: ATP-binding cassette domain-containing protein [Verrucomicrobiae bacterium]|nr:ATP-binding cassette domain-containing protein [Verrucomicrobiae bacterium]